MNVNPQRGEVAAKLDGKSWKLCLTLGALAELEAELACASLVDLAKRFSAASLTAREIQAIIGAGLRGGGHQITDADVGHMQCETGATGYAEIVTRLLTATFAGGEQPQIDGENSTANPDQS